MHKRTLNELTLTFDLMPDNAPLLIKSGREAGADPTLLDMNFVRTTHPKTGKETVFLPGSSLKGTLRSYCERVARSVKPTGDPTWCCDPFDSDKSCSARLKNKESPAERYAGACVACRTFGHTRLGSHVALSDAYPGGKVKLEQRDGVAIDRISGAVAAGPFNLEVVTCGKFRATLRLHNFQLWQVGLLAVALRDLSDGLVPIGFGKSKGFGRVCMVYKEAQVSYPGRWQAQVEDRDLSAHLYDLAAFTFTGKETYQFFGVPEAGVPVEATLTENGDYGRVTFKLADDAAIRALLLATVGHWKYAVEHGHADEV
jgi:CRISPR-associated RAMP protein (TIGR02581 family)